MRYIRLFGTFLSLLAISACSTSMQIETSYTYIEGEKFKYEVTNKALVQAKDLDVFRTRLDKQLMATDQLANSAKNDAVQVEITITSYKMRSDAARMLLGIFAGTDEMVSNIRVRNSADNTLKAEFEVVSRNATAWGTSDGMIKDNADQIVKYLTTGKPQ